MRKIIAALHQILIPLMVPLVLSACGPVGAVGSTVISVGELGVDAVSGAAGAVIGDDEDTNTDE